MILLALPSLYTAESVVYASGEVRMGEYSTQSGLLNLDDGTNTFYRFQGLTDVKQVEVIVSQVDVQYYMNGTRNPQWQISSPFSIMLTSEKDAHTGLYSIEYTIPNQGLLAGPVSHVFDFPEQWTSMTSVLISNPDDILTGATITVILHRQVLNTTGQTILIAGISAALTGTAIAIIAKKTQNSPKPKFKSELISLY
jgi:hypothetical protein